MNLDLNAARAARAEQEREPMTVTLGAKTFGLPSELPTRFAMLSATGDWVEAMTLLLNGQADAFFDESTTADLQEFVEQIATLYAGASSGESSASGSSSKNDSRNSRRPSKPRIKST